MFFVVSIGLSKVSRVVAEAKKGEVIYPCQQTCS